MGDASDVRIEADGDDTLLWIKVVPAASRDEIAGVVGDRLKVRVSAPPEGGRANHSICRLVADRLGVRPRQVVIEAGASNAAKTLCVMQVRAEEVRQRLE